MSASRDSPPIVFIKNQKNFAVIPDSAILPAMADQSQKAAGFSSH
jgi:hypothetical protein